nr:MAG TPA: hypothetical protein [Bacteriophage sp.]
MPIFKIFLILRFFTFVITNPLLCRFSFRF